MVIVKMVMNIYKTFKLPANNTEFSATFAIIAGTVPAYNPLTIPSRLNVVMTQSTIFV